MVQDMGTMEGMLMELTAVVGGVLTTVPHVLCRSASCAHLRQEHVTMSTANLSFDMSY
jgi:hypothetical protein